MKRRTTAFFVACGIAVAAPAMNAEYVVASPVDDQRREVERIVDELAELEEQADILAEDYVVAIDEKNQLDQEVVAARARVAVKEAELETLRGDLSEVAVRAFTGAGGDVLGPLFSNAAAYSDTLQRDQLSRVALSVGTATTDDLDALIADLDAERADLADKLEAAEALTETITEAQAATVELTAEYKAQRAAAEEKLGDLIVEEEARRAAESARRLAREAAATQANAAAAAAATNTGGGSGDSGGSGGGDSDDGGNGGGGGGGDAPTPTGSGNESPPAPVAEPVNYPAPSALAGTAIAAALGQQGVPYVAYTSNPGVSFDCSGLTSYAWGQAGVYLPHQSRAQAASVPHVPASAAQAGDLIFYYSPISHVGIYLGDGTLIHAPNTGSFVKIAPVNWDKVAVVGRPG
ncbi:MAG TPA: NlpC/P60 family protein [Ilumatobacteraceae bacterium]|nr:NlpC/P60 family protein [Ilumatobacteraceae bacterium]